MLDIILAVFCLVGSLVLLTRRRKSSLPYPPGPKGYPIIGNMHHLPGEEKWEYFASLKPKYGNMIHFSTVGHSILALNTFEAVHDLLDLRASIYSDRANSTMIEIMGLDGLGTDHYGPDWRLRRKLFKQHLHKGAVRNYSSILEEESKSYASRVINNPAGYMEEMKLTAARLILEVTYGIKVPSLEDEYATAQVEITEATANALQAGKFLLDFIPPLKHVPVWMPVPGASEKKWAETNGKEAQRMALKPFAYVKQEMASGTAPPSFISNALEQGATDEHILMWTGSSMYGGGATTTVVTLACFYLAMTLFPEAQKRAQDELDRVVGSSRLPSLEDREDLPYVDALVKETLRWFVIVPLGVSHRLMEDDEYKGYLIPKGTIIMPNSWAISRDPVQYPEPESFRPERFLETLPTGGYPMDPTKFVFGYGRRVCPGMEFANSSIFSTISTLLATTTISKARDSQGQEITPEIRGTGGLIRTPVDFPCSIKPRPSAVSLLSDARP